MRRQTAQRLSCALETLELRSMMSATISGAVMQDLSGNGLSADDKPLSGVVVKLYGIRIAFDAVLLRDIALDKLTGADLDAAFPNKAGRDWSARLRGCRRLVTVYVVATIAQCMAIIAMSVT